MKGKTNMLTLDKFEEASEKVKEVTLETKLIYSDFLSDHSTHNVCCVFFRQTVPPHTYINVSIRKHCFHTLYLQTAILNHIYKKRAIAKATALCVATIK